MADLKSEIYNLGYVYKSPKGKGNIKYIRDDYNINLKIDIYQRVGGVKVDHKWKVYRLPVVLRSFMTYKVNTKQKLVTENVVKSDNVNNSFYDESIDDILGGRKEILGE